MSLWQTLAECHQPTPAEQQQAQDLLDEILTTGVARRTCRSMLNYAGGVIVEFYRRLAQPRSAISPAPSSRRRNYCPPGVPMRQD
jgi:hypothetical protein